MSKKTHTTDSLINSIDDFKKLNNEIREYYTDKSVEMQPIGVPLPCTTIAEAQKRVYEWAQLKGWTNRVVPIPEQIALVHSELSEALEEWRNNKPISYTVDGKPEGVGPEYADVFIRILHYCSLLGVDLNYEFTRKMNYNDTRAYRHGGKQG